MTRIRRVRRVLNKWWQTWAALDLAVCGSALTATGIYIAYRARSATSSSNGWVDLWPNIATEVIGAWLSVRIIDYLLARRGNKSRARWRQAEILLYWRDLSGRLAHYGEGQEAQMLGDEVSFHAEPHNVTRRLNYLDATEQAHVEAARAAVADLLTHYEHYATSRDAWKSCSYDDPNRANLEARTKSLKEALRQKANAVADAALKARTNILTEEFELE